MSEVREIRVPDIGGVDGVDIVEVLVAPGDRLELDQGLVTLESDKASMEVPSPVAGTVREVKVSVGDRVAEGDVLASVEVAETEGASTDGPGTGEAETDEEGGPPRRPETAPTRAESTADGGTSARPAEEAPFVLPKAPDVDTDLRADLVVLGAGPGGYSAAFRAADLGLDVILVERHASLGGVCLNVGCIPSKALLHAAAVIEETRGMAEHGVSFGEPTIDIEALGRWRDGVVGRLTGGLTGLAKRRKVRVVRGTGTFRDAHRLDVDHEGETTTIAFGQIVLAVGSRPVKLGLFPWDDSRVMDSTDALRLDEIPQRMLVVGGGIIGLEMATVYHALGSRITVVELLDGLIPGADRDIVKPLAKWAEARYEAIRLSTKVVAAEATDDGIRIRFENADGSTDEDTFDRVLVAVGRRPNGDLVDAAAAGLEVDERGFVAVDRQMRTHLPHIYAIGDLVGQPMLAHKAVHEGHVAAEAAAGERSYFDARVIPSVAYTDPEVAWVGLTETEARGEGREIETAGFPWAANGRSLTLGREDGVTKLVLEPGTGRILGAGITGPSAGDLIAEIALAIEMGAVAEDVAKTIHPHPTLSETVGMSAEAFEGTLTDLYLPRRQKRR